jgi:PAS domain S-box-containing protein
MDRTPPDGLLDYTRDKVAVVDEQGAFTYVNDAVEGLLGYDPETLLGTNAFEYIHPEDRPEVRRVFARTVGSEEAEQVTGEYRFRGADGTYVWLESRMSNLTDERIDGYVVSSRDVTERVEAERERRETATRLAELAAATTDVLWLFDSDWSELLFVNAAYDDVYGGSIAELEADPTSFLDTVHPEDREAVEEAMAALSAGTPIDVEYRVQLDGDDQWVWVRGQPIVEDGEVVRVAGFSRDVTDRRQRENQLYVMDNLLRHNLRNDLNVILAAADLAEAQAPEIAERTATIHRVGENLLATAEKERDVIDLLTGDRNLTRVDLPAVVESAVERIGERYPNAGIEVLVPATGEAYAVETIGNAVDEVLENAIRHSEDDRPAVSVTVEDVDDGRSDEVAVVVTDDCRAIPDNEVAVLTGEHDRDDLHHSTGLGLWLVYWSTELSDGTVAVESTEDGNRVTICLPRPPERP